VRPQPEGRAEHGSRPRYRWAGRRRLRNVPSGMPASARRSRRRPRPFSQAHGPRPRGACELRPRKSGWQTGWYRGGGPEGADGAPPCRPFEQGGDQDSIESLIARFQTCLRLATGGKCPKARARWQTAKRAAKSKSAIPNTRHKYPLITTRSPSFSSFSDGPQIGRAAYSGLERRQSSRWTVFLPICGRELGAVSVIAVLDDCGPGCFFLTGCRLAFLFLFFRQYFYSFFFFLFFFFSILCLFPSLCFCFFSFPAPRATGPGPERVRPRLAACT